jgi:hypothetical protein
MRLAARTATTSGVTRRRAWSASSTAAAVAEFIWAPQSTTTTS